ncbi:hydroxyacylglutathione hydrolase [bacterium]|nr:hydroxyacylglutathione hydrolase [bacterium]
MSIVALNAFQDNYIWLIINSVKKTFICVDPGDATPVISYAKTHGLTLNHILITHHHNDHTGGTSDLLDTFPNTTVYGPPDQRIQKLNRPVMDHEHFEIDDYTFKVFNIHGHTSSHICYYEPKQNWLFCGDTLFSAGCGRVFDGTIEDLYDALQLLKNLPEETQVYCGHEYTRNNLRFALTVEPDNKAIVDYANLLKTSTNPCSLPSTIKLERQINPFLRSNEPSMRIFAQSHGIYTSDSLSIFKCLRQEKDKFK